MSGGPIPPLGRWIDAEQATAAEFRADSDAAAIPPGEKCRWRQCLAWGASGLLLGAIATGAAFWFSTPPLPPAPTMRFTVELPFMVPLALRGNPLAFSTDGTQLACVAQGESNAQLYLRPLDRIEARPVPGALNAYGPFFSPDGTWLGYFDSRDSKLKKIAVTGGNPVELCTAHFGLGASWGKDGSIIFAPDVFSGLWRVPAAGGKPEPVTHLQGKEFTHRWPRILPDGSAVIFTIGTAGDVGAMHAAAFSFRSGQTKVLLESASDARYAPSGHLLFLRGRDLMAVPFDPAHLEVLGPPFLVRQGISADKAIGTGHYAFSDTGVLAFSLGSEDDELRSLVWSDRGGTVERITVSQGSFASPRLAPDGLRLAVVIQGLDERSQIWSLDLASGKFARLTSEGNNILPVWTPDGRRLAFASDRGGQWNLYWMAADGSGTAELLNESPNPQMPNSWSGDGKHLAFTELAPRTGADICILTMGSTRQVRPFLRTEFAEWGGAFSPDGRWLAYTSDDAALEQVYVRPFPGPGDRIRISTAEGGEPVWSYDGRELFFRYWNGLMSIAIQTDPEFNPGPPRQVVTGDFETGAIPAFANYDVTRDGLRFVLIPRDRREKRRIYIDLNWPAPFRQPR